MDFFLSGLLVLVLGGILALLFSSSAKISSFFGVIGASGGSILAAVSSIQALFMGQEMNFCLPSSIPLGSFSLKIDALAGFFLLIISGISLLASLYGLEYLKKHSSRHGLGSVWLFFNLLIGSMLVVVTAANGILFIIAWEVMTLASFFLVTFEDEKDEVRSAGTIYLIATHIGTAFLFVMFWLLSTKANGAMDFAQFGEIQGLSPAFAGVIFVLSILGFGTKAGFMPFHVWLPEAHPAAPTHVSAMMSGIMIKTGIYGIIRMTTFLGQPPAWWGTIFIIIAVVSGIAGILFAMAQHDLKRFLAYSSVENIGIIAIGLGIGFLGVSYNKPTIAVLGFAGALLHIFNHAIFKSLLFLCTGAVLHETHTRELDHLGGLLKKMPITGTTFLIGAIAISGLPPLNGFVSEFFIYLASFRCLAENGSMTASAAASSLVAIVALVIIGGVALACFTKAFSIVYLGEPRSDHAKSAKETGFFMWMPMTILALLCFVVGILVFLGGAQILTPVIAIMLPSSMRGVPLNQNMASACSSLGYVLTICAIFAGILIFIILLRFLLLAWKPVKSAVTWDCGYLAPYPKLQYTSSSFGQPIVDLLEVVLHTKKNIQFPQGYFPSRASFVSRTLDRFMELVYRPVFRWIGLLFKKLEWLQHGRLHLYLLYIMTTLVSLFLWFIVFIR